MNGRSYAIDQRMHLIDFLLFQYGYLNRSALIAFFGISMPQASSDIAAYLKLAPNNAVYCMKEKTYKRTANFRSIYAC